MEIVKIWSSNEGDSDHGLMLYNKLHKQDMIYSKCLNRQNQHKQAIPKSPFIDDNAHVGNTVNLYDRSNVHKIIGSKNWLLNRS